MSRVGIFIQARNKSTRLADKIHKPFGASTVLKTIQETCSKVKVQGCECIVQVISSSEDPVDGSYVSNVLHDDLIYRYLDAAKAFNVDYIVRVTGDCPLLPQAMIEQVITNLLTCDYVSNVNPRTFPDGYDCQGISMRALEWIAINQNENREHPFFDLEYNYKFEREFEAQGFKVNRILNPDPFLLNPYRPEHKLSIDTEEDLQRCQKVWEKTCSRLSLVK